MGCELLIIIEKQSLRKPNYFNYFPHKIRAKPVTPGERIKITENLRRKIIKLKMIKGLCKD